MEQSKDRNNPNVPALKVEEEINKRLYIYIYTHTHTHTHRERERQRQRQRDRERVEFYSALKRKEFLIHAATWMNFVDFMPNEIRQSHTHTHTHTQII